MVPIKAIDPTSIHRITSGQVVIDLQTAVKELVENSLDAGATSIEVRFKDYGLKSIEVIDNGHGVLEDDYDKIALKHHTSKLASFEDLGAVLTFGFRGEALSSLCALSSSVTVVTATAEHAPMGTVLEFDRSGKAKDKTGRTARKRGTTVMITGLFSPLPVRRKEFERNSKREYGKALTLLHAYALVPCARANQGVRLTVSNHPDRGTRSVQIRTDGTPSLKAAVSTLWGPRSLENIVPLDLHLEVKAEHPSVLKKRGIHQDEATSVEVKGLISKFTPGCGRTTTDRQFFYINGRPCNPSKAQKVFNEVYRTFNANQMPFVIADFQLPTNACDINVSPDKRTIFIHSENNLILELKAKLEEAFSPSRSTFPVNSVASATQSNPRSSGTERESSPVTHFARSSSDLGRREVDDPMNATDDSPRHETTGTSARQARDRGMKAGRREEANSQMDTPTQEGNARGRQSSSSHSRSSSAIINDIDTDHGGEFGDTPDSQDVALDSSSSALDVAPPAPLEDVSMSTDVNRDIKLLSGGEEIEEPDHDVEPARRLRPHSPLFVPSPSLSPVAVTEATTVSTFNHQGKKVPVPQTPPSPSEPDIGQERPHKRARTSSPGAAVLIKTRPVQMLLGTKGAAWNLQVQDEGDNRVTTRDQARSITSRSKGTGAVTKIRSRLGGYAMTGSQVKPIEVDDDEGGSSESDVQGTAIDVEEMEVNDETQVTNGSQAEASDGYVDLLIPDTEREASQSVSSAPGTEPFVIDLRDNTVDNDEGSGPIQQASEDLAEDGPHPEVVRTPGATLTLRFDLDRITTTWSRLRSVYTPPSTLPPVSSDSQGLGATANVANADDAEGAERELARVIHKEDFASMHILGQFNLGFIITRRLAQHRGGQGVDDLFIVDQHAADEKYNFETLQQTTKIESQKLFQPRPLELTAADELVAIENIDVLRSNGFEVVIDGEAPAGHGERVKLVAQPVSKSTTFTVKDLEELLHLLQDQPSGQMVRCSKARTMFAMRACRKSVMVGMPLTIGQMTSVVRHMGTMEQPWNCPHGRPTMRHLVSLTAWHRNRKTGGEVDWDRIAI